MFQWFHYGDVTVYQHDTKIDIRGILEKVSGDKKDVIALLGITDEAFDKNLGKICDTNKNVCNC